MACRPHAVPDIPDLSVHIVKHNLGEQRSHVLFPWGTHPLASCLRVCSVALRPRLSLLEQHT